MARSAIHKILREKVNEEIGKKYLTRIQLAKKYNLNDQKVWRLIKSSGLPYDEELQMIHEGQFLEWRKHNEDLLIDRRKLNKIIRKDP